MKVILCGYHWTGCKALELLLQEGHDVYVYTHTTQNYIADLEGLCIKRNINYSLNKIEVNNLPFIPDMICSVYYRWIIKPDVIAVVQGRIFNLHPALLPKYRGCSSLTWAMINGENECGFTYHYIDSGCDTGNIILQKTVKIEDFDTQLTLYNRVMFESMKYFLEVIDLVEKGYDGKKQEGIATYYKRECPFDGKINDLMDDEMKERFVRAMCYPPFPAAQYQDREIKTLRELIDTGGGCKVAIFGCGGHARSIINVIHQIYELQEIILVDENVQIGEVILGCNTEQKYDLCDKDAFIVGIGDNDKRKNLYQKLKQKRKGYCISVVSPNSSIGIDTEIGQGTFVATNTYIGPSVKVGNNTIINTGSIVEHEVTIGDHSHIAPHVTICGRSKIGNNVLCGAGSTVIDKISVCDNVVIGAGAVVIRDIIESGVYVGTPAKKMG